MLCLPRVCTHLFPVWVSPPLSGALHVVVPVAAVVAGGERVVAQHVHELVRLLHWNLTDLLSWFCFVSINKSSYLIVKILFFLVVVDRPAVVERSVARRRRWRWSSRGCQWFRIHDDDLFFLFNVRKSFILSVAACFGRPRRQHLPPRHALPPPEGLPAGHRLELVKVHAGHFANRSDEHWDVGREWSGPRAHRRGVLVHRHGPGSRGGRLRRGLRWRRCGEGVQVRFEVRRPLETSEEVFRVRQFGLLPRGKHHPRWRSKWNDYFN